MNKSLIIMEKEIGDLISDRRMIISFILLALAISSTSIISAQRVIQNSETEGRNIEWRLKANIVHENIYVINQSHIFVVLTGLILSFDSINKEKNAGSLKVTLTYPISRGALLWGKVAARLFIFTLIIFSSFTMGQSIFFLRLGVIPPLSYIVRFIIAIFYSSLYFSIYLCIGVLLSIVYDDPSTSILAGVVASLFLSSLLYSFGEGVATLIYPYGVQTYNAGLETYTMYGPSQMHIDVLDLFHYITPMDNYETGLSELMIYFTVEPMNGDFVIFDRGLGSSLYALFDNTVYAFVLILSLLFYSHHKFREDEFA